MLSPETIERGGFLGILGGIVFIPYAITKSTVSSTVIAEGVSTPVSTAADTALAIHLFETVFVLLVLAGLLGYAASRRRALGSVGRLAVGLIIVGCVAVVLTHVFEHTRSASPVAGLPGEGGVFVYGYLLAWVVIQSGGTLLGLALLRRNGRFTPAVGVLAMTLPVAVIVGATAVVTGTYTLAGTNRLVLAALGIVVGRSTVGSSTEVAVADEPLRS